MTWLLENWLGEACALGAALTWAFSVILFKRSEQVSPNALNLFKNAVALVLLGATFAVLGFPLPEERSQEDWARLVASGVLGIAVADTLIFMALRRLGAGLLAVVDCSYAPFMVLLSVLMLGEPVSAAFLLGGGLAIGGVVLATTAKTKTGSADSAAPPAQIGPGVALGLAGIGTMALGVVLVKPALDDGHLVEVTLTRMGAGLAAQLIWIALRPSLRGDLAVFRPSPVWRTLVPASVLGTYVALLLWMGGFKWAPVSVASLLNQLSSVFTLGLAWLVLKEPMSGRKVVGALVAVSGAVLVLATAPQ